MNENRILAHDHIHICGVRCVSGKAIIIGAIVAVALSFLVNLFSLAIGLVAFPVTPEGKQTLAIGGFVGLVVLAIISMYVAGWVAGFLGRPYCFRRRLGELYGFTTWGLALIITLFLASASGPFLSQHSYIVDRGSPTMQVANEAAGNVSGNRAERNTPSSVENAADRLGIATFATFFILGMGAVGCTLGGRMGMRYRRKERDEHCGVCK